MFRITITPVRTDGQQKTTTFAWRPSTTRAHVSGGNGGSVYKMDASVICVCRRRAEFAGLLSLTVSKRHLGVRLAHDCMLWSREAFIYFVVAAAACGIAWPRRAAVPRASLRARVTSPRGVSMSVMAGPAAAFPKVKSCVVDHDAPCPLRWSLVTGLCLAPADYPV